MSNAEVLGLVCDKRTLRHEHWYGLVIGHTAKLLRVAWVGMWDEEKDEWLWPPASYAGVEATEVVLEAPSDVRWVAGPFGDVPD